MCWVILLQTLRLSRCSAFLQISSGFEDLCCSVKQRISLGLQCPVSLPDGAGKEDF